MRDDSPGQSFSLNERLRSLGRRERGILTAAIVVSVLLHIVGGYLINASFRAPAPALDHWVAFQDLGEFDEIMPPDLPALPDADNILLAELPSPLETAPVDPGVVVPDAAPMAAPSITPGVQDGVSGGSGNAGNAGDRSGDPTPNRRLEYRLGSRADVWKPAEPVYVPQLTDEEIMRSRLAGRLGAWNDSIAADMARRDREADWTMKDGSGNRWGVSNDGLHLGKITIPKEHLAFAPPPGRREEFAGRVRMWGEIQHQSARVEGDQIMQDRIKAIRARIEKERAKATSGGGG